MTTTEPQTTKTLAAPADYDTVIVAHTSRQPWVIDLCEATQPAHVCLDNGRLGCTKNHLAAWHYHADNTQTEWAVVIEDDALPIPDFALQTGLALNAASTAIVSLYLGKARPPQHQHGIAAAVKRAARDNTAWITARTVYHAVALAIRTADVPDMLRHAHATRLDIDEALTEWINYHGRLIGYTVPSLVDHRDDGTIAKHRDGAPRPPGRTAYKTGSRDDWATDATLIE